ncbi:hypothetical protein BDZ97DRAFT_1781625 [Flammula alnicola]|nr:hypothetical protein BDZ97DRAFT_1781625 [Flammula alnicola]
MDTDETRSVLDTKISKADDPTEILQLKHARNALSPACSVPPEVLCNIFAFAKAAVAGELHPDGMFQFCALEWVRVTHVCKWWRDVALNASSLWTDIALGRRRWAEEMFVRSKEAPLAVHADFGEVIPWSNPIPLPQLHVSRIRELNVIGTQPSDLRHFLSGTTIATTLLQIHTLRITYLYGPEESFPYILSDTVFKPNALRRLSLKGCNVHWDASFLSGLTHLRLHEIPSNPLFRAPEFLEILRRLTSLESLDARHIFFEDHDKTSPLSTNASPKVNLPHLKMLRLAMRMVDVANILSGIVISPNVTMKLYGYADDPSLADYLRSLSTFSRQYRPLLNPSIHPPFLIQSLELSRDLDAALVIRIYPTLLSQDDMATPCIPPLMESIFYWDDWDDFSKWKIAKPLFHSLPLDHLIVLHISGQVAIDIETWAQTFGTLPALRSIHIEHAVTRFFDSLVYEASVSHSGSFPLVPFQALESISISYSWDHLPEDSFSSVIQVLIERYELGAEIHQLFLKNCRELSRQDLGLLREVVVDVTWDGDLPPISESYPSAFEPLFADMEIEDLDFAAGYWY